jgi:hypothetical protein
MKTMQHRTKTHQHSNNIYPAKVRCEEKVKTKNSNRNLYSHQQRLFIILAGEVRLLLPRRTAILCPVHFLAAVVARVVTVLAAAPAAAASTTTVGPLLLIARPVLNRED